MKKYIVGLLAFASITATAQIKDTVALKETVVSASRWEQEVKNVPSRVVGITAKTNAFQNQQTAADMLQNTGQIFVQKSQTGGGSTVLRGFESSRVSLVIDGVRMNNAIYRLGHLQDVITIDQSMLQKTEVLFGPSSTMYGSDALGGVVHFYTKNPKFNTTAIGAYLRYSSANNEKTGHIDFNLGSGKFASLTSVTYSDFGDLHVGNTFDSKYGDWGKCLYYVTRDKVTNKDVVNTNANHNVMVGSAYKQYDILEKLSFKQSETVSHELNIQLSNNVGNVPRYDRMLLLSGGQPKFAENAYGPQTRFFAAYTLDLNEKTALYDDAKLILSTQKINQDRINRRLNSNNRTTNLEDANIYAANFDLTKKLSEKANLYYGAEYIYNGITSTASVTDIVSGKVTWNKDDKTIATRFADGGSSWSSLAAYAQMNYKLNEIISATGGLRLTSVSLTSNYNDATLYPVTTVKSSSIAPSGTLGLVANLPSATKISVLGSTGFRAPNVEDMTAFSPASSDKTARVPNSSLKPEYAYNGELNVTQKFGSDIKLDGGAYYTVLTNAMVVRDTKYNGSDFVTINGTQYKAQSIQNADHGNIYGWYLAAKYDVTEQIAVNASLNATYGKYTVTNGTFDAKNDTIVPMDHIPPMFGKVGVSYTAGNLQVEAFTRFSAAKKLADYSPSGEDNLEQAAYTVDANGKYTVAAGAPAWYTLNLRAGYSFTKNISLNAGVENILDVHYRQFASGISAPGRNIYGTLRLTL